MKNNHLPGLFIMLLLLVIGCIVLSILTSHPNHGMRAKIVNTMADEKLIASTLKQRAVEVSGLTNIDNSFVYRTVFDVLHLGRRSDSTNSQGEILDIWKMAYQIQIVAPTNFIIRSAGPGRKFGDKDDIIFNSAANDFVQP